MGQARCEALWACRDCGALYGAWGAGLEAHGHDDIEMGEGCFFLCAGFVVVGLEQAGAEIIGEFEQDIGGIDDIEGFDEVGGIEADLDIAAAFAQTDGFFALSASAVLAGDGDILFGELEANAACFIGAEEGDTAQGFVQFDASDAATDARFDGDDLPIIGEGAFDEHGGEALCAVLEGDFFIVEAEAQLALFDIDHLAKLAEQFAGEDLAGGEGEAFGGRGFCERKAVSIGGDGADILVFVTFEEDAAEVIARFIGGDGEDGTVDQGEEILDFVGIHLIGGERGGFGEIDSGEGVELEFDASFACGDLKLALVKEGVEADGFIGEVADDLVKIASGDGGFAGFFDLGFDACNEGEFFVGGGDFESVFNGRAEAKMRQDRTRGFFGDDALRDIDNLE